MLYHKTYIWCHRMANTRQMMPATRAPALTTLCEILENRELSHKPVVSLKSPYLRDDDP
jgi:hypothetical protein